MLRLRRSGARPRATLMLSATRAALWRLAAWLAATDPGLARLTMAVRGTSSVFLATSGAILLAQALHVPAMEFASGITYSLMVPFLSREPTLRQRQRSLLILTLPAMGATIATTLLHGYGITGDAFFLVLVFACFLLHPRSPRFIGIGLSAVVTTYVGLYLELPPATLPIQLLSVLLAAPVTAFACFVLVPVDPARTLRRAIRAVQWRAAQALRSARPVTVGALRSARPVTVGALHSASPMAAGPAGLAALRRDLVRLNEATLAADDQLALLQPIGRDAVRAGLIDLELKTARLINALRPGRTEPGLQSARAARRLTLHQERMRQGREYHMRPGHAEPGTLRGTLVEIGHTIHGLGIAAGAMRNATEIPESPVTAPGPLAWRLATRVTLAAALAMAGGMALSPQRWFWAVITVYLVFLNTRSRGDALYKGAQRVGGTLLGIACGLVLATLLTANPILETASLLLSVFGMYYFITTSYTAGILCVTVMLGLLYGMLGASLETLLILRLEETAIGAAAAMFVAAFVLPQRTRDQVQKSGRAVLSTLSDAVRISAEAMQARQNQALPSAAPLEAMRRVDRQVADLRIALAPLTASRSLLRRSALERPVPALLLCVHWARVLAVTSQDGQPTPQAIATAQSLAATLASLASGNIPAATAPQGNASPNASPNAGPEAPLDAPLTASESVDRLAEAVTLLAERIEIGTIEAYNLAGGGY